MESNIVAGNTEAQNLTPSVSVGVQISIPFQGEIQPHEFQEMLRQAWVALSAKDTALAKPEHQA